MNNSINIYCDESCHLENDDSNAMGLAGIWGDTKHIKEANKRIIEIKERNRVHRNSETKWAKVGPAKLQLYKDLINYFFDDDDLHFRVLVIPDKSQLQHEKFHQTHDEWYYKMYFTMLKSIFSPNYEFRVFVDIKDTHSSERIKKLHDVCCNDIYDFSHSIIKLIQPISSEEVQIMQLVDILLGAVVYENRIFPADHMRSSAKEELVQLIKNRSKYTLQKTTLYREDKFNIFIWSASYGRM